MWQRLNSDPKPFKITHTTTKTSARIWRMQKKLPKKTTISFLSLFSFVFSLPCLLNHSISIYLNRIIYVYIVWISLINCEIFFHNVVDVGESFILLLFHCMFWHDGVCLFTSVLNPSIFSPSSRYIYILLPEKVIDPCAVIPLQIFYTFVMIRCLVSREKTIKQCPIIISTY